MLSAREMRLRVDPGSVDDLRALACGFRLRQSALANGRAYRHRFFPPPFFFVRIKADVPLIPFSYDRS
jgi:hypothetical protein